jgi:hypothetical protein
MRETNVSASYCDFIIILEWNYCRIPSREIRAARHSHIVSAISFSRIAGLAAAANHFGRRETSAELHSEGSEWEGFSSFLAPWATGASNVLSRILVTLLHSPIARVRATQEGV